MSHDGAVAAIGEFARLLREHGFRIGIAEQQALVTVACTLPVERWRALDPAWRAVACQDLRSWRLWPDLYQRFWFPARTRGSTRVSGQTRPSRSLQQVVEALQDSLGGVPGARAGDAALNAAAAGEGDPAQRAQGGASRTDPLHDRSLAQWLPQDLGALERCVREIVQQLRRRLTRRWQDDPQGRRLDLRRTLRNSLRTGGLPVYPAWRAARRERPRLFILVDVSRSMETHAQLFLRIARAFVSAVDARVFVFHTRLAEITALLRSDSPAVQEKVNAVTAGFGGGTRIATSVADFRGVHVRAQLTRHARVWVLSDGFDADPADCLRTELHKVRARGARITWFHPSDTPAGSAALAQVKASRGLVTRFVRLNSLRDLAGLAEQLD